MPNTVGTLLAESDLEDLGMHTELCGDAYFHLAQAGKLTNRRKSYQRNKGVSGIFFGSGGFAVDGTLSGHGIAFQILVVGGDLVDQAAGGQLHDPVGRGLDDLVVAGGEQKYAREFHHAVS